MNFKKIVEKIILEDKQGHYSEKIMKRNHDRNYWSNRIKTSSGNEDEYLGIVSKDLRDRHELYLSENLTNKSVFEISCGNGYWMKKFLNKTIKYNGLEPTIELYEKIPSEYKKNILCLPLEDLKKMEKYDIIFETISLSSIYFHLDEKISQTLHNSLNENGKLVFLETNYIIEIDKNLQIKEIKLC